MGLKFHMNIAFSNCRDKFDYPGSIVYLSCYFSIRVHNTSKFKKIIKEIFLDVLSNVNTCNLGNKHFYVSLLAIFLAIFATIH